MMSFYIVDWPLMNILLLNGLLVYGLLVFTYVCSLCLSALLCLFVLL